MQPTPKLRTRQQITLKYMEVKKAEAYYNAQRAITRDDIYASPMVLAALDKHIAECEAWLDALLFCLNDVV